MAYLKTCFRRTTVNLLCAVLDSSFLYEPPIHRLKAALLRRLLGANLAPNCFISKGVRVSEWRNLYLDEKASLLDDVIIHAHSTVHIGRNTLVAPEVYISTGDHSKVDLTPTSRPITIGTGVFVGARAIILGGVSIGNDAIIGAGAVVTKSVPDKAIAAGVPVRVLKFRGDVSRTWTLFGMHNVAIRPAQADQTRSVWVAR